MKRLKYFIQISIILVLVIFTNILNTIGEANEVEYIVMPNDSIYKVSIAFGVSTQTIIDRNNISLPSLIVPGQKLIIPNGHYYSQQSAEDPQNQEPTPTNIIQQIVEVTPITEPTTIVAPTINFPTVEPTVSPLPTPTPTPIFVELKLPPEQMTVSVNVMNCDSKTLLYALALSMDKRVLMIPESKLTSLSLKVENHELLPLVEILLNNELCTGKYQGSTLLVEPIVSKP